MRAYLYLAKRNKKGTKLVARLQSPEEIISKVDLKSLNLAADLEGKIKEITNKNKLDWDLWIETASSYEDLKKKLRKRGYTEVATHPVPMIIETMTLSNKVVKPPKVMTQRKSR